MKALVLLAWFCVPMTSASASAALLVNFQGVATEPVFSGSASDAYLGQFGEIAPSVYFSGQFVFSRSVQYLSEADSGYLVFDGKTYPVASALDREFSYFEFEHASHQYSDPLDDNLLLFVSVFSGLYPSSYVTEQVHLAFDLGPDYFPLTEKYPAIPSDEYLAAHQSYGALYKAIYRGGDVSGAGTVRYGKVSLTSLSLSGSIDEHYFPAGVPEPEGWLTMLFGFGVVGATMRPKRPPIRPSLSV